MEHGATYWPYERSLLPELSILRELFLRNYASIFFRNYSSGTSNPRLRSHSSGTIFRELSSNIQELTRIETLSWKLQRITFYTTSHRHRKFFLTFPPALHARSKLVQNLARPSCIGQYWSLEGPQPIHEVCCISMHFKDLPKHLECAVQSTSQMESIVQLAWLSLGVLKRSLHSAFAGPCQYTRQRLTEKLASARREHLIPAALDASQSLASTHF